MALEKQETQPMKRDQILRQLPPVISGNLPPADLPNPHEPIRSEETMDGFGSWSTAQSTTNFESDDSDDQERHITSPLRSNMGSIPPSNGKSLPGSPTPAHTSSPTTQSSWLGRLLRLAPHKGT